MTNVSRFKGKVALVTGGASGIGEATVKRLSSEGARVVIVDKNESAGSALADSVAGRYVSTDMGDATEISKLFADVSARENRLDVLINNAGIVSANGETPETPELKPENWRQVMAVNLDGIYHACRHAIPLMRREGGSIVNTASISGLAGDYGYTVYNASKGGLINYTRALALDHAKDGIRVNAVCPGLIETPLNEALRSEEMSGYQAYWHSLIPMGRAGSPNEVASMIAFLASGEASYMTGSVVVIDGGQSAGTGQPGFQQWSRMQEN